MFAPSHLLHSCDRARLLISRLQSRTRVTSSSINAVTATALSIRHQSTIRGTIEQASAPSAAAAQFYRSTIPFKAQFSLERVSSNSNSNRSSSAPGSKNKSFVQPVSHITAASHNIPHPKKRLTGGEDAHVIVAHTNSKSTSVLAVYDGVGSWSIDKDVCVADFSRALAAATVDYASGKQIAAKMTPLLVMEAAWQHVCSLQLSGGSTACIITHKAGSNTLNCANLGDSGFLVFRPSSSNSSSSSNNSDRTLSVVYHSTFSWHYFNCPFQLGIDVDKSTDKFDAPSAAETFAVVVQPDDLIVLSSDGLFDNIDDTQLLSLVQSAWRQGQSVSEISVTLAEHAFKLSGDKMIDSPFCVMAREENILWRGGRADDITVIVAKVEGKA